MFDRVKKQLFMAKIMAEIKAQHNDQAFVDRLFFTEQAAEHLEVLRTSAYYRKDVEAPFIHGCHMLRQGIADAALDEATKATCGYLLIERLTKAQSNPAIWAIHIDLFSDMMGTIEAVLSDDEEFEDQENSSPELDDCILSSEFSSGRYVMSHYGTTSERVRDEPLNNKVKFIHRSDDLNTLKSLALVQTLGGIKVELWDSQTNTPIDVESLI